MVDPLIKTGPSGEPRQASNRLLGYQALGKLTLPQFQEYIAKSLVALGRNNNGATLQKGLKLSFQNHSPTDTEINDFVNFLCRPFCDKEFRNTISDSVFDNYYISLTFAMAELLIERYEEGEVEERDDSSSDLLKPSGALRVILESNPGMLLEDSAYSSLILTAAARKDLEDLKFVHKIIKELDNKNLECVSLEDTVFSDALDFAKGADNYAEIEQVISDIKAEFSK